MPIVGFRAGRAEAEALVPARLGGQRALSGDSEQPRNEIREKRL